MSDVIQFRPAPRDARLTKEFLVNWRGGPQVRIHPDTPIVKMIRGLNSQDLTISNDPQGGLLIHPLPAGEIA